MKNNALLAMIAGLLFFSALLAVYLSYEYNSLYHQLQNIQPKAQKVSEARTVFEALLKDTVEYSKKNPAIMPILEPFSTNPAKTGSAAPAAKPLNK